ncbi:MAG: RimK/LysX family protein [Catalinimonas sp.]
MSKLLIGRADEIDLPELGLEGIAAKVDTGAYTSSIHCSEVKLLEHDGRPVLSFHILDEDHADLAQREFRTEAFDRKQVRNSFGHVEERFAIRTQLYIFGQTFPTVFTLSNRADMRYPVLLGRKFLNGRFVVDPVKKNIWRKLRRQQENGA